MKGDLYAPYWWDVRIFQPGEVNEVTIRFRPDGASNGFGRRVPETYVRDAATKALSAAAARDARPRSARRRTGSSISRRMRCSSSRSRRVPAGAIDHAFVYQRAEMLGEARIRLRLTVAGDELTGDRAVRAPARNPSSAGSASCAARTTRSPESPDCRPGSSTGSAAASSACCGSRASIGSPSGRRSRAGIRRRRADGGDDAVRGPDRLVRLRHRAIDDDASGCEQLGAVAAVAFGGGLGVRARVHGGGEPRAARVPRQPQLWRVWSAEGAAPSRAVLGRTLGGYGFVPIELALVAASITRRTAGSAGGSRPRC